MDFFQNQDAARKKTGLLIVYFVLAVVVIIVSVYLSIAAVLAFAEPVKGRGPAPGIAALWDPQLFGLVALGTAALISGGSLYKVASLAGGGHTVAELLGGRLVHPETSDPDERRVLNVVEEMAIASGVAVPPVYLLEAESGINAFAAGHAPGDAVVAVTSGCVHRLTRDELQGVIAHEFSHILNGDMRLNIRLMGVLFGILLIGLAGWILFRSTGNGSVRVGSRNDDRKGNNALPLIGLALYIIGYAGVFFGNLIKAAVSRQREYLADASAVQFTRNPEGIAGALKKIGALSEGSRIENPHAEEASHMFFGNAVEGIGQLFGLLATHPPLADRIRRIDPSFDGDFSRVRIEPIADEAPPRREPALRHERPEAMAFDPVQAVARVGTVAPAQLAYAADLLESMPWPLSASVRESLGAQAVIHALLLDPDESIRRNQLAWLETHAMPASARETRKILPEVHRLDPGSRLPLVELAVPALRQMTPAQFHDFFRSVEALVQADRKVTLFEYALQRLLICQVVRHFVRDRPPAATITTFPPLVGPTSVVLSALARFGHESPDDIAAAFEVGAKALGWPDVRLELVSAGGVGIREIDAALKRLAAAAPMLKKQILEACATCIVVDGRVTVEEGEMLRAVSDTLGCPMPPLLAPGETPSA